VKYIDPKFIQRFGTAMNEFAYSLGKKNFFVFGEVADNNANIAAFVGRNGPAGADAPDGGLGIDAALDFPSTAPSGRWPPVSSTTAPESTWCETCSTSGGRSRTS
jgi:hypothetical protein